MAGDDINAEVQRRRALWDDLVANGGPTDVLPGLLRQLGIYGGAQGIWVNKTVTGQASPDGAGIAVGVLHNGSSYDDDLSDDGIIYYYPNTGRPVGRDAAETAALRNAASLHIPIFVITKSKSHATRRDVRVGWAVGVDDAAAQCLIEFGGIRQPVAPLSDGAAEEFRLEANRSELARIGRRLKRTPQFAFEVGRRCGWRCAVCCIQVRQLLDAAHVRGVAEKGSDDPRNGLILCKNHHSAFDGRLISFQPETGTVVLAEGMTIEQLGLSVLTLPEDIRPHVDALRWRWKKALETHDDRLRGGSGRTGGSARPQRKLRT
jgi:hypothetical protein